MRIQGTVQDGWVCVGRRMLQGWPYLKTKKGVARFRLPQGGWKNGDVVSFVPYVELGKGEDYYVAKYPQKGGGSCVSAGCVGK